MFPLSAPVSSAPLDPKVKALSQQLDKLDGDLASAEESMLSRLRTPLNRSDPAGDLAKRLREQEVREIKPQTLFLLACFCLYYCISVGSLDLGEIPLIYQIPSVVCLFKVTPGDYSVIL